MAAPPRSSRASTDVRERGGLTFAELLVAAALFVLLVSIVAAAVGQALALHEVGDAQARLQGKLRRVGAVLSQDLRSAVFGGLLAAPYPTGASSISLMLLDGGSGYGVLPTGGSTFAGAATIDVIVPVASPAATELLGHRVLVVNAAGEAMDATVASVTAVGGSGSQRFTLGLAGCTVSLTQASGASLTRIRAVGYRFDPDAGLLLRREPGGAEVPLAFDIDAFELGYVYDAIDGAPTRLAEPLRDAARPLRRGSIDGVPHTLQSVDVTLRASARAGRRDVDVEQVVRVTLSGGGSVPLRSVASCP
jgi:hypothetical protein